MGDYILRAKNHFKLTRDEVEGFIYTTIAAAFILTFQMWGTGDHFDAIIGIRNLILGIVIVGIALAVHISAQKLLAIRLGSVATYTYSRNGLFIGVLLAFLSWGYLPLLLIGSITIDTVPRLRLGRFRYGLNMKDLAKISFAGPAANMVLVLLIAPFVGRSPAIPPSGLLDLYFWANFLIAIYALLPIPNGSGLNIFVASRSTYVFAFFFVLAFFLLVLLASLFSIILAAFLGVVCAIAYATIVDKPST